MNTYDAIKTLLVQNWHVIKVNPGIALQNFD